LNKIAKPGNTLLDVGAASGIFLDLARKEGYEISGIEPSSFLVKEAESVYGLKLFRDTIENFRPGEKFAVITLLDILEHVVEPDAFMDKIDTLLEKDGIIVIVTPDINSFTAKIAGKCWWHYRIAHINFFNLESIIYLLNKHACQVVKKKRYAWHFSLFYLLTRIFPSLKNKKALQKILKSINLKLQLFDSWEIYARKK
jgi:2-polyprenyl-3-methyl-5-hydroxy-6-metoxy-1,4-benzoquinol methylase